MTRFLRLAYRNLARNRRRSLLTVLTLLVGTCALVILRGLTEGAAKVAIGESVLGRVGALQIHRAGYVDNLDALPLSLNLPLSDELMSQIASVPGVTAVAPRIVFSGLVSNGIEQSMFIGRGIDPVREKEVCPRLGTDVRVGERVFPANERHVAQLGHELATGMNVKVRRQRQGEDRGVDTVTLSSTSPGGRANAVSVSVIGLTQSGLAWENKRVLTVPLTLAQSLLGLEGRATEYAVGVKNLDRVEEVAKALRETLGNDYEVHVWSELHPFIRDQAQNLRAMLSILAAILSFIVMIGIINTMLMSVFERVREIGTMIAFGVKRRQILLLFLMESALVSLFGAMAGATVGALGVVAIAHRGIRLPALNEQDSILRPEITWSFMGMVVVGAVIAAVAAAIYPAWKASRQNPVDALRSV